MFVCGNVTDQPEASEFGMIVIEHPKLQNVIWIDKRPDGPHYDIFIRSGSGLDDEKKVILQELDEK